MLIRQETAPQLTAAPRHANHEALVPDRDQKGMR
jgi:hypothetical protein